jgi:hypothetical protein
MSSAAFRRWAIRISVGIVDAQHLAYTLRSAISRTDSLEPNLE